MAILSFEDYVKTLGSLSPHVDPTASTPETEEIRLAAAGLKELPFVNLASLQQWINVNPQYVPILGLTVGLSRERLKNVLRNRFDTSGWMTLARECPVELIEWLDEEYDLVRQVASQKDRAYDFGDILVARAGTRATATRATRSGRRVEDEIEAVAKNLGLPYETRTRYEGRNGRTAPCDLVVPRSSEASIVVAAKGFDSTGSKLTDAVREIEEMADVRKPNQFVMAVVDGIGWKNRTADLRRIHSLWATQQIDGMYTLATLNQFEADLNEAAKLRHLL